MTHINETSGTMLGSRRPVRLGVYYGALWVLLFATATSAAAKLDQVRSQCAKSAICKPIPQDPRYGGQDFCIDSKPGGSTCETVVWCPGDGSDCGVIGMVAGKRKLLPNRSVDALLQTSSR